jgi:hypothetical protein
MYDPEEMPSFLGGNRAKILIRKWYGWPGRTKDLFFETLCACMDRDRTHKVVPWNRMCNN